MRVKAGDPKVAIAYMRVSTTEQHLGLEAQQYAVEQWAKANGVLLAATFVDRLSGGTGLDREGTALDLSRRPALMDAVEALTGAGAGLLLLAKRDRLARMSSSQGSSTESPQQRAPESSLQTASALTTRQRVGFRSRSSTPWPSTSARSSAPAR